MACIHRYRFENNGDDSIGSVDGTIYSPAVYATTAAKEGSYGFNGSAGGYWETDSAVSLGSSFSISLWIRRSGTTGTRVYFSNMQTSDDGIRLQWEFDTSKIRVYTGNGTTTASAYSNTTTYTTWTWAHIVIVVDKTAGTVVIYRDGSDITSTDYDCRTDFQSTDEMRVGQHPSGWGTSYSQIDDFQIYDEELTADDADYLYDNPGKIAKSKISGTISTSSTVSGDCADQLSGDISGTITTSSTVSGDLTKGTSGTISGSSTVSGDIRAKQVNFAGTINTSTTITGDLREKSQLGGLK